MLRIVFLLLVICSQTASARMYQWVDPESGSTQLSGKPPMWYRSAEEGPRVFVFENSKIVDDTGIEVSDTERERLRQKAFLQADADRERARQKLLQAKRMDAALKQKQAAKAKEDEVTATLEEEIIEDVPEEAPPAPPSDQVPSTEEMRKLIADWERAQTEKARDVLQNPGGQ